ncbi:MAG: cysteine hydrolase family protein [Candidatus Asgardarchaeia archaeon]
MKAAIFVIDMLKEFVSGGLKAEKAEEIISKIKEVTEYGRKVGIPIFYLCDSHEPGDPELKLWGPHAMKGSEGAQVVDEIKPKEGDKVIEKKTYTGFFNTKLDDELKKLGIDTLILTGIHTHICVQHTAADAFYRGYKIMVLEDATAAFTKEAHESGLNTMKQLYGADVMKVSEAMEKLRESG